MLIVRQIVIALLLVFPVTACMGTPLANGQVRIATSQKGAFDTGCPAGRIDGTLVIDAAAGTAVTNAAGTTPVIWPTGYTGLMSRDFVKILDAEGTTVAETGFALSLGGGIITSNQWWSTCGPPLRP